MRPCLQVDKDSNILYSIYAKKLIAEDIAMKAILKL
jgi:hypothetical protein